MRSFAPSPTCQRKLACASGWCCLDYAAGYPAALLVVVVALATDPNTSRGDVFLLTSGGRIEGEWLNRDEQPPKEYLVRTASGIKTSLQVTQVREVVRRSPLDQQYERKAAAAADTPAGQWELAEWCRQQSLFDQRKVHLRRIVELDPQHAPAWRALGYQFLDGQWITRDQFRRGEGYEFYKGKWRTPQEIEIVEAQSRTELAQKEWLVKLKRWRADLNSPERARTGFASLSEVRDPLAVKPLGEMFARERARKVKTLYADILAAINTPEAVAVLVNRVLYDPDEEIYYYCLDRLIALSPPHLADPFITALRDKNNMTVNRSAAALGRINDRTAIEPLIAALITTHSRVQPGRASPDATSATFSGDGNSSLAANEGPKVIISRIRNQPVLDALIRMTGANFEYDQKRWHYWHAQERQAQEAAQPVADARRQ